MGTILATLFLGVSVLATQLHPYPSHDVTVFAQMGKQVFGDGAALWVLQILTAGILILAANTAYADFPRLSSIVARDGYLPRQLATRGDRLVFSNGIVVLALMASALIVAFGGITNALIPLYAVGVFTSFTLSQSGMVRHHLRERNEDWKLHAVISGVGATATFVVLHHRGGHEVHERRVDPARRHPGDRAAVQGDQAALRRGGRGPPGRRRVQAPPHEPHHRRARRQPAPRRARGARLREVARPEPPDRDDDRLRRGGAGAHREGAGPSAASTSRSRSCTRRTGS